MIKIYLLVVNDQTLRCESNNVQHHEHFYTHIVDLEYFIKIEIKYRRDFDNS